jgi:molybdenum cofactor guanylyltransferase
VAEAGARGIAPADITGLVLAGGLGTRMGGVDKGLQLHGGVPLALRALRRLAPQVGATMLNANRNLQAYADFGAPVWPDSLTGFAGPLAGVLTGLEHCSTAWLVTVPCDAPLFPTDLVQRLAQALADAGAELALATTSDADGTRLQPVFCLMKSSLRASLSQCLQGGERRVEAWATAQRCVRVPFADAHAFANANTLDELQRLPTATAGFAAPPARRD